MIYKTPKHQKGIFDEAEKLERLSGYRDPLTKITSVIDFELFRDELEILTAIKILKASPSPLRSKLEI